MQINKLSDVLLESPKNMLITLNAYYFIRSIICSTNSQMVSEIMLIYINAESRNFLLINQTKLTCLLLPNVRTLYTTTFHLEISSKLYNHCKEVIKI